MTDEERSDFFTKFCETTGFEPPMEVCQIDWADARTVLATNSKTGLVFVVACFPDELVYKKAVQDFVLFGLLDHKCSESRISELAQQYGGYGMYHPFTGAV